MESERNFKELIVHLEGQSLRLDKYLASSLKDVARSHLQQMIKKGLVLVDGKQVKANFLLRGNETLRVFEEDVIVGPFAEDIPLSVLYEDEDLVVVDKPSGMLVHGNHFKERGTLVNALLYKYGSLATDADDGRPGIVHRLDKDTSGVMLVARTNRAYHALVEAFKTRTIEKTYLAICCSVPKEKKGVIDCNIDRVGDLSKMTVVKAGGKESLTHYEVIESFDDYSLVKCMPKTGRTHQIRVHMKHIGCPLVCDEVYSRDLQKFCVMEVDEQGSKHKVCLLSRHALHSYQISFMHPVTGNSLNFTAPLPLDIEKVLSALRTKIRRI